MSDQTLSETPGATQDTAVVVSRLVSHPIKDVWKVLLTDEGTEALLGAGGKLGDKGQNWQADDGTHGVTRSFHPPLPGGLRTRGTRQSMSATLGCGMRPTR